MNLDFDMFANFIKSNDHQKIYAVLQLEYRSGTTEADFYSTSLVWIAEFASMIFEAEHDLVSIASAILTGSLVTFEPLLLLHSLMVEVWE